MPAWRACSSTGEASSLVDPRSRHRHDLDALKPNLGPLTQDDHVQDASLHDYYWRVCGGPPQKAGKSECQGIGSEHSCQAGALAETHVHIEPRLAM